MWKQCRNKSGKDQEGTSETVDQMVWLCVGWTRRGGKGRAQKRSKVKVQKQNSEEEVEEKESETDDGGET